MIYPFGSHVTSPLSRPDFRNVASHAFDSGHTLPQMLIDACRRHASQPAFSNLGRTLSFGQIDQLSDDFASYLRQQLGLASGERVAIMLPNLLQFPIAVLGVLRADLIAVLVNPLYTARELHHQLVDSGAAALVVLDNFGAVAAEAVQATAVKHVITTRVGDMLPWPKSVLVNTVLKHVKKMIPSFHINAAIRWPVALSEGRRLPRVQAQAIGSDTAQLQYTGGTTGLSKGAVLPHSALIANVASAEQWLGHRFDPATDAVIVCLPMYHIAAYSNAIYNMTHGIHSVLVTNPRDIPALAATFAKVRPAGFAGVNTLYDALLNSADFAKLDLSYLKVCLQGGTALRSGTAERWKALTGKDVVEGYGLSETSAAITFNRWDQANPVGSIGLPMAEVEISLRDNDGNVVASGEAGELCVRGPHVTTGYWQQPDETRDAFFDGDWFRTGDIARVDENGYYFLLDRRKDMILVSGFNVFPNEVEDVVAMHPGVLEAGVVGMPDEKTGEAVRLVVVRKDPALSESDLRAYCRQHLTAYKQPKQIEFRDALPKTAVGKVLRRELRK
ncbi:AMP-binding protein [Rhodanobacter sp. AS-Z3]|uniref:AMP-binding protein n=1 Tax=Rhodanobacter sp. AS-Z3 TaxID=3031330 RepID=UPI002479F1B8|nr:AMP-binding protein [Rhodanobacter sp. AS-Z3]WEN14235.1 AMP-binding protein [Rhodanobacter sp. AS-Z3]